MIALWRLEMCRLLTPCAGKQVRLAKGSSRSIARTHYRRAEL